jgi:hypothetical protein
LPRDHPTPRVDNWAMDGDRAETYLRLLAETELRSAAQPNDGARPLRKLLRTAEALKAVGAINPATAASIAADFQLAMAVRHRPPLSQAAQFTAHRMAPPGALPLSQAQPSSQAQTSSRDVPERVLPLGLVISLRSEEPRAELCLLAYTQNATGASFTMVARLHSKRVPASGPAARPGGPTRELMQLTATDEHGTSYALGFRGGGSSMSRVRSGGGEISELIGELSLRPDPPPGIRWLDLVTAPGAPALRIDLGEATPPQPEVTVTETSFTVGEHLLNSHAAQLLAIGARAADGLGTIVEALRAAAALPADSPVPGQLVRLCDWLGIHDHGIAAPPARDDELPEPWLDMLTPRPSGVHGGDWAAAAVLLPEIDGAQLCILGVHRSELSAVLHMRVTTRETAIAEIGMLLPVLWLRADGGAWHVTRASGRTAWGDGEVRMQLDITPPLPRTACMEVLVAGRSVQALVAVPLIWGTLTCGTPPWGTPSGGTI